LQEDIAAVETSDRVYLAGEIDWTGLNGQKTPQGDTLESFYTIILARQNASSPVVAGSLFWSLFEHNVPDCTVSNGVSNARIFVFWEQANNIHADIRRAQ
jgi:mannan endo-1,4-beta-mannosidase